jgi:hypothetical protein
MIPALSTVLLTRSHFVISGPLPAKKRYGISARKVGGATRGDPGGVGGLSLALSLHAAELSDLEVFEAAPSIEELGVGINVLPHAVRELTELGLADELAAHGVLDARTLARALALEPTIRAALDTYEGDGRSATAAVVLANRQVGAEQCMELAESRAPDGFERIEDVFASGELEALSSEYKRTAGFALPP